MRHQLLLYIQPAYNCLTREMVYAEVLIREYRGIEGVKKILKFVTNHNIEKMFDLDVIEEVFNIMSKSSKISCPIGINLCPKTIEDADIIDNIVSLMNKYNISNNDIIIEINEGTNFSSEQVYDNIMRLHDLKIQVALDDFGVEKANLYSIIKYKFDILKVDKSFVGHEREESRNKILSIIQDLCTTFNMKSIVEGVEEESQLISICNAGYTVVQGYLYDRPLPYKEFMQQTLGV